VVISGRDGVECTMAKIITLYLVTNTKTGKTYVGVTGHKNLRRRFSEHVYVANKKKLNGAFQKALRKYDRSFFTIVPLAIYETREEAFAAEIAYIKKHNPAYNSTKGGPGSKNHIVTSKMREQISRQHKGNKYRLGATHTDEVRDRLREHAKRNIQVFKQYQNMGSASQARRVRCLDDGFEYKSASEAARQYGVARSALIELCLKQKYRRTVGGFRFEYVEGIV
jgi:group I intron endonuclease